MASVALCNIGGGTVSERPKVQLSKSCVGESPPWVQIPPVPPEGLYVPKLTDKVAGIFRPPDDLCVTLLQRPSLLQS